MRTFDQLLKDPEVRAIAIEFDSGVGKNLKLKYMQLLRCFMGTCSLREIAKTACVCDKKLAAWYEEYEFNRFVGFQTAEIRGRHNASFKQTKAYRQRNVRKQPISTLAL